MSVKTISTTVTWEDVAYYFGILAVVGVAVVARFSDIKKRTKFRFGDDGSRIAVGFLAAGYALFIGFGLIMIWRAAHW